MNPILRKVMLPGAIAVAVAGFVGAFGGSTPAAYAIDEDICQVDVDSRAGTTHDGQGNDVYVTSKGTTYGLVFRVEDTGRWPDNNVTVRIDSETGSARITSKAEILGYEENDLILAQDEEADDEAEANDDAEANESPEANTDTEVQAELDAAELRFGNTPNVGHILVQPAVGTQTVDTVHPRNFNDADGHSLNSINAWLTDVGYPGFADDSRNVCGGGASDSWGFIDFECIESGYFHIDILAPGDTEETGNTVKFYCPGQADSATIAVQRSTVETDPTEVPPAGFGTSLVTVTVYDQAGNNFDGAEVTFTTDNCHFDAGDGISPAAGGQTVTTHSDTDTSADDNFLADNPLQDEAGTAEVTLDCTGPDGNPGVANITAIVQREGANIVLNETVTVVGPTSSTGLTLTLTPDDIECGETILAVATAVDDEGKPVSDGTPIYFTTDTSSGVVGGVEGAQGGVATKGGEASVLIATDPGNSGTHTVIAYTLDQYGRVLSQVSKNYVCDGGVAPVAPTTPPSSGGPGTITPPSTGDAGLAAGSSSSSLFVLAGAVALALAGVASVRFARN